jgi:hypothetical protein
LHLNHFSLIMKAIIGSRGLIKYIIVCNSVLEGSV